MSIVSLALAHVATSARSRFFRKRVPPPPTYFAMCMQIKGLQRSVGDRYANKGLSGGFELAELPLRVAAVAR
jgi:hypothetical protein